MNNLNSLIATFMMSIALLASTAAYASPAPPQYAIHNGSLMQITPLPNRQIEISYIQPRPTLWGLVVPGMVLVRGQWQPDHTLAATAFVFPGPPSQPVPYQVSGAINPLGVLTLVGPSPIVSPWLCYVVGMAWTNNSTLVFVPQGGGQ
jgi:hypothetical protein